MTRKKRLAKAAQKIDPSMLDMERKLSRLRLEKKSLEDHKKLLLEQLEIATARAEAFEVISESDIHWRKWHNQKREVSGDTSAILVLTDWHIEERIDLETTNGANRYSPQIAEKRARRATEKFLEMLDKWRSIADVNHIVIAILGDIITGYIHDELVETNYMSPVEATLLGRDLLCSAIETIKRESKVEHIDVLTCNGNHGRTTKKMRHKTAHKNSYEWGLYHFLARSFENDPSITFRISESYHNWLTIQGHKVRFHHGDSIRYQGGVGGISVPVNKAIAAWNKRQAAALDIFGHWHQFIDEWRWVSCGCLIGFSEFAIAIKADYQPPTQTMILVAKKRGKVAALPLFVD